LKLDVPWSETRPKGLRAFSSYKFAIASFIKNTPRKVHISLPMKIGLPSQLRNRLGKKKLYFNSQIPLQIGFQEISGEMTERQVLEDFLESDFAFN